MYLRTSENLGLARGSYVEEPGWSYFGEPVVSVCPSYEKNEVEISRCKTGPCQEGHLPSDVIQLPRGGILIADFGVGLSEVKPTVTKERLFQSWIRYARSDLFSIILRITGYSDCVGTEKDNLTLREARARHVYDLLDKDLQSRADFVGAAKEGLSVTDNKTRVDRATNRSVMIEILRLPEQVIEIKDTAPPRQCTGPGCKPPPPPPPRQCVGPRCPPPPPPPPPPCVGPSCKPQPPQKPSKPWTWPWQSPRVIETPVSDDGTDSWIWKSLTTAAAILGVTITVGMRSLSKAELASALDAAWLAIQLEEGGLAAAVGAAGEAAAQTIIARVVGSDLTKIFNLNDLQESFPLLDIAAGTGLFSVKVKGLLTVGAKLNSQLVLEYTQDLIDLAVSDHPLANRKLAKAAQLLFDNRNGLERRGSWPRGFNPRTVDDVANYIQKKSKLLVPHDHVQVLKQGIGQALNNRIERGLKLPPGTNRVKWVNSFVDRIDSIGVKTTDLQVMLDATKLLPEEQVGRLQRELAALRRLRRRRPLLTK